MFGTLSFAILTLWPSGKRCCSCAQILVARDVNKIARRLYTSDKEIAEVLAQLCRDGLLIRQRRPFSI